MPATRSSESSYHDRDDAERPTARDHDLASFTSLVVHVFDRLSIALTLLGVLLDDRGPDLPSSSSSGSFFEVVLCPFDQLLESRFLPMDIGKTEENFPETVALKLPIVNDDVNSPRSRKLWSSMAQELQILKNDHIASHGNVVDLLGICWRQIDGYDTIMPVLVLEAAPLGDLENCINNNLFPPEFSSARNFVGLSINMASGLQALHDVGITHLDLKPQNILIFKDPELGITAKLADFGSSIILDDVSGEIQLRAGTLMWQAPEYEKPVLKQDIMKLDIYSLGLVVANMISGNRVALQFLKGLSPQQLQERKSAPEFAAMIAMTTKTVLRLFIRKAVGDVEPSDNSSSDESLSDGGSSDLRGRATHETSARELWIKNMGQSATVLVFLALCESSSDRLSSARELHDRLRHLLHDMLRFELIFSPAGHDSNFNEAEKALLLHPGLDESTSDDARDLWQNTGMSEMLDDILIAGAAGISDQSGTLQFEEWRRQRALVPKIAVQIQDAGAVLDADRCFGTLRLVPPAVVKQLSLQLAVIADDATETPVRRGKAGLQHAVMTLSTLQFEGPSATSPIQAALRLVHLAAELGNVTARGMTAWLHEALGAALDWKQGRDPIDAWLREAMFRGSETAARHLKSLLSAADYAAVTNELRSEYGYTGYRYPSSWLEQSDEDFRYLIRTLLTGRRRLNVFDAEQVTGMLQCFAMTGKTDLMRGLLENELVDVNLASNFGESALFWASRAGHTNLVLFLLEKGADPRKATAEGLTPLHFLASFDGEDIPAIARALVQHHAPVEARSTGDCFIYHTTMDSVYGRVRGTPLTWAVAANNLVAIRTLVDLGADPFDKAGETLPTSDSWSGIHITSPVMRAAQYHQWYLLEVLLQDSFPSVISQVMARLGLGPPENRQHGPRPLGPWGVIDKSSLLDCCARYSVPGTLRRLLLHGKDHQVAFYKTFEILANRAGNMDAQARVNLLLEAVKFGQPFVIRHVMSWKEGSLRPEPGPWLGTLATAVRIDDKAAFDTLLEYKDDMAITKEQWTTFFGAVAGKTDDVGYFLPLLEHVDKDADFTPIIQAAFLASCPQTASWLYTHAKSDLSRRCGATRESLLGQMVARSKHYSRGVRALRVLLDLPGLTESTFHNVTDMGDSILTALHAAVLFSEYGDSQMRPRVLEMVLDRFHEPWQLNYQVEVGNFAGFTPLHIAVQCCNLECVRLLLDEDDVDRNILTRLHKSAMDLGLENFKSQNSSLDFWRVPQERRQGLDMSHYQKSIEVYHLLREADVRGNLYSSVVVRTEPADVMVIPAWKDDPIVQLPYIARPLPEYLHNDPFFLAASALAVDRAFFVCNQDADSETGQSSTGTAR